MPFVIRLDRGDRILEVSYPDRPTASDVTKYMNELRAAVEQFKGEPWSCLVDQRSLAVMPPELADEIASLNAWAVQKGMRRSARIVATAIGALQGGRLSRLGLGVPVRVFQDRDQAVQWLRSTDP